MWLGLKDPQQQVSASEGRAVPASVRRDDGQVCRAGLVFCRGVPTAARKRASARRHQSARQSIDSQNLSVERCGSCKRRQRHPQQCPAHIEKPHRGSNIDHTNQVTGPAASLGGACKLLYGSKASTTLLDGLCVRLRIRLSALTSDRRTAAPRRPNWASSARRYRRTNERRRRL